MRVLAGPSSQSRCGQVSCHARYVAIVKLFAGRYELGRVLGAGGMAKVYAAHDERLDRPVAVKLVPTAQAEPILRQRFIREARSAAAFTHPNAVALFDAGEADDFLYLVMEFVDGQSLADRLAVAVRSIPAWPGTSRRACSQRSPPPMPSASFTAMSSRATSSLAQTTS